MNERLAALEKVRSEARGDRTAVHWPLGQTTDGSGARSRRTANGERPSRGASGAAQPHQAEQPVQWLFDAIDQIAASGRPVLIGPWTGEVGFELLYWIPFVRWVRAHWNLAPEREVIVSRGGVASWYTQDAPRYVDILALFTPDDFRSAVAEEKRKHRKPGAFDDRIVEAVAGRRDAGPVDVLHPGLMYRLFAPYWSDEAGYALIDQFTRHQLIDPPAGVRPPGLPAEYVAVRFYFNECFPPTAENRAFARQTVAVTGRTIDDCHAQSRLQRRRPSRLET